MKLFGIIAGILCLFCWCIPSEAEKIDCPGASPRNIQSKSFVDAVNNRTYWTVVKTGNTNYEYHPLGKNIDRPTLVIFSDRLKTINNYYDHPFESRTVLYIKNEQYSDLRMDDEKVICKTNAKSSKLYGQEMRSYRILPALNSYKILMDIEYRFALIDEMYDYGVLIFESCSSSESDTWYLIEHSLLRKATGPNGTLNVEIGGIRVDHMPEIQFTPFGVNLE